MSGERRRRSAKAMTGKNKHSLPTCRCDGKDTWHPLFAYLVGTEAENDAILLVAVGMTVLLWPVDKLAGVAVGGEGRSRQLSHPTAAVHHPHKADLRRGKDKGEGMVVAVTIRLSEKIL